jgi:hypothetical protein
MLNSWFLAIEAMAQWICSFTTSWHQNPWLSSALRIIHPWYPLKFIHGKIRYHCDGYWILDIGYSRCLSILMTIQTIHWISDTIMGTFRGIGIHIGIYGRNHPIFEVGWLLRPNHDQLPRNPGVVSSVDRYYPCDFVDDKFYGPKDHRDQLPPPGIQKGIPFKG